MPSGPVLEIEVTEDARASVQKNCERCRTVIKVGERCHEVINRQKGTQRECCGDCFDHYAGKLNTTVRKPRGDQASNTQQRIDSRDVEQIRADINSSQRKNGSKGVIAQVGSGLSGNAQYAQGNVLAGRSEAQHFYPAATPFQQQQRASSSMGPPPGLGSNAQAGSWGPPLMAPGTMLAPSPAIGYTSNHFSYGAERSRWAKIPYASAGVETFTMVVSVFSKIPGKLRGSLVANLNEGIPHVPAASTPFQLRTIALNAMLPKLNIVYPNFHWDCDRITLRDEKEWIDLGNLDPSTPYYYLKCLQKNNKSELVFKTPKNPFKVVLVISAAHMEECSDFMDGGDQVYPQPSADAVDLLLMSKTERKKALARYSACPTTSSTRPSSTSTEHVRASFEPDLGFISYEPPSSPPHRKRNLSSNRSPVTPPAKRSQKEPEFESPEHHVLQHALMHAGGGHMEKNAKAASMLSEIIVFYAVDAPPFHTILNNLESAHFTMNPLNAMSGTLHHNPKSMIGKGAFKTVHFGVLRLNDRPATGLGSAESAEVAVKRMYISKGTKSKPVMERHPPDHEKGLVQTEANLMRFSTALMRYSYAFINREDEHRGTLPPFPIPSLRFVKSRVCEVHAALPPSEPASTYRDAVDLRESPNTTLRRSMLCEEIIHETEDDDSAFVKYIHNMSATPLLEAGVLEVGDARYELAQFLCFMQHIQYQKTSGLVYISDLQGSTTLLSDPQIMTNPDTVGQGSDLFGAGNVDHGFRLFTTQHVCNKYCRWYELQQLSPSTA